MSKDPSGMGYAYVPSEAGAVDEKQQPQQPSPPPAYSKSLYPTQVGGPVYVPPPAPAPGTTVLVGSGATYSFPGAGAGGGQQQPTVLLVASAGRNSDGLQLPVTRSFGFCVGLYKVLLVFESLAMGLVGIALLCFSSLITLLEKARDEIGKETVAGTAMDPGQQEKEREKIDQVIKMLRTLLPLIIVMFLFGVARLIVAWKAAIGLRLRFLRIDLALEVLGLLCWLVTPIMATDGFTSVWSLLWNLGEIGLVFTIIHEIKKVNGIPGCCA